MRPSLCLALTFGFLIGTSACIRKVSSGPTGPVFPTATATVSIPSSITPTATTWPTLTPTPTWTTLAVSTATPTRTATTLPSSTATATWTLTRTATSTASRTPTAVSTATSTFSPTWTASPLLTATRSATPSPSPTHTYSPTALATSTHTATAIWTSSLTFTPTRTPSPTASATPSSTRTASPSATPTLTNTSTRTTTATWSPSPSATASRTRTFTSTPTSTSTPGVSATPTVTGTTTVNTTPPATTARLIFIHHSTGCNWLTTGNGDLGTTLNANNYYVSEAYYGWSDPPSPPAQYGVMGDNTDTIHWPYWFNDDVMPYVYAETEPWCYTDSIPNPGGANEIILFKSCFPNSEVGDDSSDEQAIYNSLLPYFTAHPEKMFVLVVPPPMQNISHPELARQISNWLVDPSGYRATYTGKNLFVFDMYNILTDPNNHHWVHGGVIQHVITSSPANPASPDTLYYPTSSGDDHPNTAGNQKLTAEFVPLLNAWYRQYKGL